MKITREQQKLLKEKNLTPYHLLILDIINNHMRKNNGEGISKYDLQKEFIRRKNELGNIEYEV